MGLNIPKDNCDSSRPKARRMPQKVDRQAANNE